MGFNRTNKRIPINNKKLKEFSYCTLTYLGDVHDLLADELIKDNKILTYLKENDDKSLDFLRTNLKRKLRSLKAAEANGTSLGKNDGIYMNFLAYEAIEELYDILPLYLLQRSDVEKSKFGVDSVFYSGKDIWIFEFKSSISSLNEQAVAKKIYKGVESLFCMGEIGTASLYDCQTIVENNGLDTRLNDVLQRFIDNSEFPEKLIDDEDMKFNICIVSPSGAFSETQIKDYINNEYLSCDNCSDPPCKKFGCPKFEKIKILNVFHLQLPTIFSLETLYNKLLAKLGV